MGCSFWYCLFIILDIFYLIKMKEIIIFCVIFVIFFVLFMYKLSNPKWFGQFMTDKFEDKDLFTKIVKFIMS